MKDRAVPAAAGGGGRRRLLFPRGSDLAVIADGDGDRFWLCRALQHVYEDRSSAFAVQWLEKAAGAKVAKNAYLRSKTPGKLERESVLCKVKLNRANKGAKVTKYTFFSQQNHSSRSDFPFSPGPGAVSFPAQEGGRHSA